MTDMNATVDHPFPHEVTIRDVDGLKWTAYFCATCAALAAENQTIEAQADHLLALIHDAVCDDEGEIR